MRTALQLVLILVVALAVYSPTRAFDFVHADDADLIVRNQPFLSDLGNAPRAFERSYFEVEGDATADKTYYRPLAIVSFMVDAARGGARPRPYHVTNTALHAAAAGLLYLLALAWGARRRPAAAAALLFVLHPLNVQAVAWIAGRNDLLLAVSGLLSLLAWSSIARRARGAWAAGTHVAASILAIFSKETGVFFPLLAVLHHRVVRRQPLTRLHRIALAADAAAAVVWMTLRARALEGASHDISSGSFATLVANLPQLLVHAGKTLVPVRLNVSPGVDLPGLAIGALALAAFAALAWRAPRGAGIALAWWLAFLLPTLVVPGLPVYEHRAYVPMVGLLLFLARRSTEAAREEVAREGAAREGAAHTVVPVLVPVLVPILLLFLWLTHQRLEVFRDPFAYWTDGTRDARFGPIAHVNLGQLHEGAGRPAEARREYLRALERDPATPKAHNNLGVVLMALDEPDLALRHFREETRRHPWNANAWFNLGVWHDARGKPDEARRYFERAIAEDPGYLPAYARLRRPVPGGATRR